LRARGAFGQLALGLGPVVGLGALAVVWAASRNVAGDLPRAAVLGGALAVLLTSHLLVAMEAVARAGRGEGMAAALYQFPVSPLAIHLSETLAGLGSPVVLGPATVLLAFGTKLSDSPFISATWMLIAGLWLLALRQVLGLVLAVLLRRRWLRELALALLSTLGLGFWLAANLLSRHLTRLDFAAQIDQAPAAFWYLPPAWFVAPFAALEGIPASARLAGLVAAPVLLLAALLLGADLQDRACYGETEGLFGAGRVRRAPRRRHLADRPPFSFVPSAVWATADRELKTMRRDPFLVVSLVTQGVVLLLPPLLLPLGGGAGMGGSAGAGWIPGLLALMLMAAHAPAWNSLGSEGRSLLFLAQTPAPRWQLLLGKNLAHGGLFGLLDAGILLLACAHFGALGMYPEYLVILLCGGLVVLGAGNAVSVLLPLPWIGARAAAGGPRAAQVAAEGGVPEPGCLLLLFRFLLLNVTLLFVLPPALLVLYAGTFMPGAGFAAAAAFALAWGGAAWLLGTLFASARLRAAEDALVRHIAARSAG
jgi:hypothetical protein